MFAEIICNHITSLDPQQLSSQRAYLRMCVDMSKEQALEVLEGLLNNGMLTNSDIRGSLNSSRPDLVEAIRDDAVSDACEAYQIQRDRMATS